MQKSAKFIRKLPIPMDIKKEFPLTEQVAAVREERVEEMRAILDGRDKRLMLVIGPCSADREDSVMDYIYRLVPLQEQVKDKILIVPTANSAAGMRKAAPVMAKLALKLMKGEKLGASSEDGYMPNGVRVNFFEKERGSKRAVDMLLKKLADKPFTTEYPMPSFDRVAPNPAVKDLSHATVALCTSGGIVPKGNPDHIESSSASHYGEYCIKGVEKLTAETYETAHGGYDPVYANDNPNRVLPVDVMREFEREGRIGKLHDYFYTTVGNGTSVANAKKFAAEYAQKLLQAGVNAVIMTST